MKVGRSTRILQSDLEALIPLETRTGDLGGGGKHFHAHVSPVYNLQALDAAGMDNVLKKHSDTLTKHVTNTIRRMNK